MRPLVRNAGRIERTLEDEPHHVSGFPMHTGEPDHLDHALATHALAGAGEQRIVRTEAKLGFEEVDIVKEGLLDILAKREEEAREALAKLGLHIASILIDPAPIGADMLELQRGERLDPNSRQKDQGDHGAVPVRNQIYTCDRQMTAVRLHMTALVARSYGKSALPDCGGRTDYICIVCSSVTGYHP